MVDAKGFRCYLSLRQGLESLEERNHALSEQNDALLREINALRNDPAALERAAREVEPTSSRASSSSIWSNHDRALGRSSSLQAPAHRGAAVPATAVLCAFLHLARGGFRGLQTLGWTEASSSSSCSPGWRWRPGGASPERGGGAALPP